MDKVTHASLSAKIQHAVSLVNTQESPQLFSFSQSIVAKALEDIAADFKKLQEDDSKSPDITKENMNALYHKVTQLKTFTDKATPFMKAASAIYNFFINWKIGSSSAISHTHIVNIHTSLGTFYEQLPVNTQKASSQCDYSDDDTVGSSDSGDSTISEGDIERASAKKIGEQIAQITKGKPPIPPLFKYLFQQKLQIKMRTLADKQLLPKEGPLGFADTSDDRWSDYSLVLKKGKWHLQTTGVFSLRNTNGPRNPSERPTYKISIDIEESGNYKLSIEKDNDISYADSPLDEKEITGNVFDVIPEKERQVAMAQREFDTVQLAKDAPRLCNFLIGGTILKPVTSKEELAAEKASLNLDGSITYIDEDYTKQVIPGAWINGSKEERKKALQLLFKNEPNSTRLVSDLLSKLNQPRQGKEIHILGITLIGESSTSWKIKD